MAAELMLINPRRRRRHRRRKMSALQRRYFGKGHAPVRHRRRRRHRVTVANENPRRRHHRRLRIRRVRRNPSGMSMHSFTSAFYPAAIGAAGALGVDMVLGSFGAQLPPSLTDPSILPITRLGLAFGIGYVGQMTMGRNFGNEMAAGAITVTLYDLIKSYMQTNVPSIPLARYVRLNRYVSLKGLGGMGNPRRRRMAGLGYVGPGRTAGRMPFPVMQNIRPV